MKACIFLMGEEVFREDEQRGRGLRAGKNREDTQSTNVWQVNA